MSLASIPRYDPNDAERTAGTAVVVGGGAAGLIATRVLADHFERVVLCERDPLSDSVAFRRSVPQDRQPHLLLGAGQAILDDLLPGLTESVIRSGGMLIDWTRDLIYYEAGGHIASGSESIPMLAASRPLLEYEIRSRVRAWQGIELKAPCHVSGYHLVDGQVSGVVTDQGVLEADFVVDASGRSSTTPSWLAENGYERPAVEEVTIDVEYSSVRVSRPSHERRMVIVPPSAPRTRGGGAFPIENDQWIVTLQGMHGDSPPSSIESFRAFTKALPIDDLTQILEDHSIESENAAVYPFPVSRRHRYERLADRPDRLVVIGDALATFNPIYGQGISVSALEAMELHQALLGDRIDVAVDRYFKRAATVIDSAWRLSVGSDFRFDQTEGPRPRGTRLTNRYLERLFKRAHTNAHLAEAFAGVAMMQRPMTDLLRPSILWRVYRPRLSSSMSDGK